MSKRKREIQKKKKQTEDAVVDGSPRDRAPVDDSQTAQVPGTFKSEYEVADSQIVSAPRPAQKKKGARKKDASDQEPARAAASDSWFGQNKENLLLGLLIFYVFLLGLGTMGELFEIEWVLNLPLFK